MLSPPWGTDLGGLAGLPEVQVCACTKSSTTQCWSQQCSSKARLHFGAWLSGFTKVQSEPRPLRTTQRESGKAEWDEVWANMAVPPLPGELNEPPSFHVREMGPVASHLL